MSAGEIMPRRLINRGLTSLDGSSRSFWVSWVAQGAAGGRRALVTRFIEHDCMFIFVGVHIERVVERGGCEKTAVPLELMAFCTQSR